MASCSQATCNCHAELADATVLRRERDELERKLIEAHSQLAQCNAVLHRDVRLGGFAASSTVQPTSASAQRADRAQPHAAETEHSSVNEGKVKSFSSRGSPTSRSLQQAESVELNCSTADVKALSAVATDAKKAKAVLANMTVHNAACADCLQACAKYTYRFGCLVRCQHQRENQCTNTTMIASLIPKATLQDRGPLVSMIEKVTASCAYCILETFESVRGGCVRDTMHITTDYPILPRPCLPELAEVIKSKPPAPQLPILCSTPLPVTAETDRSGVVQLNVIASASPLDVACILADRFRGDESDSTTPAAATSRTLTMPTGRSPITMLADLIVNNGQTVRIEADPATRATLVVGERQLQVRRTVCTVCTCGLKTSECLRLGQPRGPLFVAAIV